MDRTRYEPAQPVERTHHECLLCSTLIPTCKHIWVDYSLDDPMPWCSRCGALQLSSGNPLLPRRYVFCPEHANTPHATVPE